MSRNRNLQQPARARDPSRSHLSAAYLDSLWQTYFDRPEDLAPAWRNYFEQISANGRPLRPGPITSAKPPPGQRAPEAAETAPAETRAGASASPAAQAERAAAASERPASRQPASGRKQQCAARLIDAYRTWGHLAAALDPLERPRPAVPELALGFHSLEERDLDAAFFAGNSGEHPVGDDANERAAPQLVTLREITARLRRAYCGPIGAQFMHLRDAEARQWIARRMEAGREDEPSDDLCLRMHNRLTAADVFEHFVRKKYVGAKTFSLAGAESLIPLLDLAIEQAAAAGVLEIVMAMAHRGRLNVLANILGKRPQEIFREFAENAAAGQRRRGDVRYHLGHSSDWLSHRGDRVHLSLCFNPSHLEFVNPVAMGRTRAKQQRAGDAERVQAMLLLIHGDAAFAAEGIVQEALNLRRLEGYATGGSLHVVVNNQLGFTTSPGQARSTTYPSDVALAYEMPVFHVNGDDVDAVARVVGLAMDFRERFRSDAVIDLFCYRRLGHNEMDEPSFTQPEMYRRIENSPGVREIYVQRLLEANRLTSAEDERLVERHKARLEREFEAASNTHTAVSSETLAGVWTGFCGGLEPDEDDADTRVAAPRLKELLERLTRLPDGFHLHRKLQRGLKQRREMASEERAIDWSAAEALALASLAVEGHPVRLSGEDTARGTFSQRHAVWHDTESGETYMPLAHLADEQERVEVVDSPLCESGCLGFEYGYSLDYPEALVAWEAQFGDFWNAAQVMFDQFLASAEDKWSRLSGLVLLLPHGFEGQGPEHSSARLERILLSTAEHNLQVAVPSTPSQYFHLLRRQVLRRWRKPLVVLTPKSLLRHRLVASSLGDLADGAFRRVLPDTREQSELTSRLLLCCGKVYYDLLKARDEQQRPDTAILRIEQLYPFPTRDLCGLLEQYSPQTPVCWVQEEPANMGAWPWLQVHWPEELRRRLPLLGITPPESASPASGSHRAHKLEQRELIDRAFGRRPLNES